MRRNLIRKTGYFNKQKPLQSLIGNRIYGCDDCQLVSPVNHFAESLVKADFNARHQLDASSLLRLLRGTGEQSHPGTTGKPGYS